MKHLVPLAALAFLAFAITSCDSGLTETTATTDYSYDSSTLAKQDKFGICHWDEYAEEYIPINVAEPALEAHFTNHGDFYSYNDSCECPCFTYEDLLAASAASTGYSCGSGNGADGARVGFRYSGYTGLYPYTAVVRGRTGAPYCSTDLPGGGGVYVGDAAVELIEMCRDHVLMFCD